MQLKQSLFTFFTLSVLLMSCQKSAIGPAANSTDQMAGSSMKQSLASTQTFNEGFESASKTAYAAADVTFDSGSWNLDDALVGTSTSDRKTGSQSIKTAKAVAKSIKPAKSKSAKSATKKPATKPKKAPAAHGFGVQHDRQR